MSIDTLLFSMMNTIEIIQESEPNQPITYRAICGEKQALGRSPGQALDELEQQLTALETNTLIIVMMRLPRHCLLNG